jgi:hypothetical protein
LLSDAAAFCGTPFRRALTTSTCPPDLPPLIQKINDIAGVVCTGVWYR